MTDWTDDPAVQDASAILTQLAHMARAELAVRGLHPVSVAYGDLDSAEAVDLTGRLAVVATELGCAHKIAGNNATTSPLARPTPNPIRFPWCLAPSARSGTLSLPSESR